MPNDNSITVNMTETNEFTNSMNKLSLVDDQQVPTNDTNYKETLEDHQRNIAALRMQSPNINVQPRSGGIRTPNHNPK